MGTAKTKAKTTRTGKTATAQRASGKKRTRGKLAPGGSVRGLDAADVAIAMDSAEIAEVIALVRSVGGAFIGAYRDPLGGRARFSERTLAAGLREREGFASRLLDIDAQTKRIIETLQKRGFKSPYLRNYVVARINPVRFHKAKKGDTKPPMPLAQALTRMAASAKNFKVDSVSNSDLAWVAVGAGAAE
jgi:hypothetical protein